DESSSLYAELGLTDSESESDEEMSGIDAEVQDKGQAGPNPGEQDEGQAGPNPGNVAASHPPPCHVVLAGPDLEHVNLEASDTSIQPNPEQIDDEFTTTAYPNVQENLKLPTEGEVRLEDPASSPGTLYSLQNLDKELSFTNQFLAEKSQEDEPEKTNIEAEVQSMATVPIHQDTSSVPLMTTPVIDLTGSRLYKLENLDIPHKVSKVVDEIVTDTVDWALQAPLMDRFRDLPEADMKEILHHPIWETNSYTAHEDHKQLKKKKRHALPKTPPGSPPYHPPPPPPPADPPSSSKTTASAQYTAWTTTDSRHKPFVSLIPEDLHMDNDTAPDEQVHLSDDEYIGSEHIPTASALASTYAPPPENSLLAQIGDMATFMDWFYKKQGITEVKQQDLEGPAYEIVKVFHPYVIHLQYQMENAINY
ncbi:hypothetical protein Tco_1495100, partial [Tanacetum coccineum]